MRYVVTVNGEELEVTLEGAIVRVDDIELEARASDVEGTPLRVVTIGGRVHRVVARRGAGPGQYSIQLAGYRFEVEALDERTRAIRQLSAATARASGPASLVAPMPGLVVRVLVQPGDQVQSGQGLIVIEAMKMENELRARTGGVVRSVSVAPGAAVEKGALLVEFEPSP